jgi:hypothetical protein
MYLRAWERIKTKLGMPPAWKLVAWLQNDHQRLETCPPRFNSFTDFEVVTNFCDRWRKRIQVDEMKVQKWDLMKDSTRHLRDLAKDSTWRERWLFHFLMSLTQEKNYAQSSRFDPQIVVSFFNELATEKKTMLKASISFFNELATEKRNYARDMRPTWKIVASVSFFNELATEKRNYAHDLLDHGSREDNALEGYHVKGQESVMVSKRSSLDGR